MNGAAGSARWLARVAAARARAAWLNRQLGEVALRFGDVDRAHKYFRCSYEHRLESEQALERISAGEYPRPEDTPDE